MIVVLFLIFAVLAIVFFFKSEGAKVGSRKSAVFEAIAIIFSLLTVVSLVFTLVGFIGGVFATERSASKEALAPMPDDEGVYLREVHTYSGLGSLRESYEYAVVEDGVAFVDDVYKSDTELGYLTEETNDSTPYVEKLEKCTDAWVVAPWGFCQHVSTRIVLPYGAEIAKSED